MDLRTQPLMHCTHPTCLPHYPPRGGRQPGRRGRRRRRWARRYRAGSRPASETHEQQTPDGRTSSTSRATRDTDDSRLPAGMRAEVTAHGDTGAEQLPREGGGATVERGNLSSSERRSGSRSTMLQGRVDVSTPHSINAALQRG